MSMLQEVLDPRNVRRPHSTIVRAHNFDQGRIHVPFRPLPLLGPTPVGEKLCPDVESPYWKRPIYKAFWPYRNNFNYDNYVTDPFHWNHVNKKWQNYRQNWYFYDDPLYYRRYRDSYSDYFERTALGGHRASRSRLVEDIYLGDHI